MATAMQCTRMSSCSPLNSMRISDNNNYHRDRDCPSASCSWALPGGGIRAAPKWQVSMGSGDQGGHQQIGMVAAVAPARVGVGCGEQGDVGVVETSDKSRSGIARFFEKSSVAVALALSLSLGGVDMAEAKRLEGVNKPELLPKEFTTVIDVAGFLSSGQEVRIKEAVASLEQDTGYKLRVLAQNYPNTPGLAVRDFWKVDDNTVVFVADPSLGNILNFNVGAGVDLSIPRSFWTRLAGKYGNKFYWQEMGEDASIEAAVTAIGDCLREPAGPRACADIK